MTPAVLDHLWQSTLFALGAGLLTLSLRGSGAAVRYNLWLAASLKFLVPFALLASLASQVGALVHPSASIAVTTVHAVAEVEAPFSTAPLLLANTANFPPQVVEHTNASPAFDWTLLITSVWALGAAAVLAAWTVRWLRVRAIIKLASPIAIAAPIPAKVSPSLLEPGIAGIVRPVLLFPEGLTERLTDKEVQAILAHELAHLHRRDNLTAALHMAVEALFWFYPPVWWIGGRLIAERERACDEAVVASGHDPHAYAHGILESCRLYVRSPLDCVAGVSGANLTQRVTAIMTASLRQPLNTAQKLALATTAAVALAIPLASGVLGERAAAQSKMNSASLKPTAIALAVLTPSRLATLTMSPPAIAVTTAPPATPVLAEAASPASPPTTVQAAEPTAPTATPADETARLLAEQQAPQQLVPFDPPRFDRFAGNYQLAPNAVFKIWRDGDKFFTQLTGQGPVEVFPEGNTKFFATVVAAQISFVSDANGTVTSLVLHQGGREQTAYKIDDATLKNDAAAIADRIKDNKPSPGTEASVRKWLLSLQNGQPDYEDMTPDLVQISRLQWPPASAQLQAFGALKALKFLHVSVQGHDVFQADFEHRRINVGIGPLTPDGKIASLNWTAMPDEAVSAHIGANTASPGTEAALRRYLASASQGQPDYSGFSPAVEAAFRAAWPTRGPVITARGALKSLAFVRVDPKGNDMYDAVYENSEVMWSVAPPGPTGKSSFLGGVALPGFR